jgi:hypothetical protein
MTAAATMLPLATLSSRSFLSGRDARSPPIEEIRANRRSAERKERACKEHCTQAGPTRDGSQCGATEPKSHVETYGVGSHREATALWRSATVGFDAEARIDQRIAKARERGPERQSKHGPATPR